MKVLFDHRILFLDESGFNLHTSNKYGYSIPDTNAIDYNIGNRGRNVSLCSILAASGIIYSEIVVGAFNGIVFKQFIINALGSRNLKEEDVLIMDNASIHKIAPVRELLTQNGVTVKFCFIILHNSIQLRVYLGILNPRVIILGQKPKRKKSFCAILRAIAEFNQLKESVIENYFQRWRRNLNFTLNNCWDEINN